MGTISHDAIIVTGDHERVEKAHDAAVGIAVTWPNPDPFPVVWADLISPVIAGVTNGYASFFIAPDGSKEWWSTSDEADDLRAAIERKLLDMEWLTVVQVKYGELGEGVILDGEEVFRHAE